MFQKLVSHNDDLRRLVDKGYAVAFDGAHLVVRDIPYLDTSGALQTGAIVAKLVFVDQDHVTQDDHQVYFAGGVPHELSGKPVANLGGGSYALALGPSSSDVVVQRSFSNKPRSTGRFDNFFDKIESYVARISGPAENKYSATALTFSSRDDEQEPSVFKFRDTLTSKAEIRDLSRKLENDVVAVIGLGGTGAYLLDFIVKAPVKEIRAFDLDEFHVHNAFRSPGKLEETELGRHKTEVYAARYENFREALSFHSKLIDEECAADLDGVTFAFVCVDRGSSRSKIVDLLLSLHVPFIDVGMGPRRKDGSLRGMVRTTYFSVEEGTRVRDEGLADLADSPENIYRTNIQISELNALNAALAVIRFKQLRGFYADDDAPYHALFNITDLSIGRRTFSDAI